MISKPTVNISLVSADTIQNIGLRRNLIICQTPNATANALVTDLHNYTQAQLDSLLGAGSYCRVMVQQWLDSNRVGNNVGAELDVITLFDDVAATAATKIVTIVGTATVEDSFTISILSSKLYKRTIAVAVTDTETDVADAIKAAYAGVVAPFTVDNTAGVVTITATDLGTIGNDYGVEVSKVAGGLTSVTIAAGVTGANPPTVTDVMDLVGSTVRYQGILCPFDLPTLFEDEVLPFLDDRFNLSNDILDGVAFYGNVNTLALLKVDGNSLNTQSGVMLGDAVAVGNALKSGGEIVHPIDFTATEFMAIRARRLSNGASIASMVTTNASGDQFGGRALASLPYFNTPLADTPVTDSVNLFSSAEQAELNTAGVTVYGPNKPITDSIMGTVVTTYKTNPAGNDDVSFKYLNYVDTASVCREFLFNNLKSTFAQSRLTDGDLIAGKSMENAASIAATVKGLLAILKDDALVRKGRTADRLIEDNLDVTLDLANRKATVSTVLPIVTQLETIDMPLKLTFELA